MSWLKTLDFVPPQIQIKTHRTNPKPPIRPVKIKGVRYKSLLEAKNKLGLKSYSQVYRLIGESWRYGCRKR